MEVDYFVRMVQKSQQNNCFYHFTDRQNLLSIQQHGLFSKNEQQLRGIICPAPGGNDISVAADSFAGLGDYVHLCFMKDHPMAYKLRKSGKDICLIRVKPSILTDLTAYITLDVANQAGVSRLSLEDGLEKLDKEVCYQRMDWKAPEVQERLKKVRRCEILVHKHVPKNFLEM